MYNIKCTFPLIGDVSIDIKSSDLFEFTKRQLKNYIVSHSSIPNIKSFVSLNVPSINNTNFEDIILGREIKFKDNELHISKKSRIQTLSYKYNFNDHLTLNIDLKKKSLYYLKNLLSSKYSINHILFYQTILYPIFSLYAMQDSYSLVHGSLIKINDKYIVLTGLDGVGKSSLSYELLLRGHKILADNFVLSNGKSFVGLNMPIRLDLENDTKENIIYEDDNLKEVLFDFKEDNAVVVDNVYFLSISENLAIKELDKNIVTQNWHLINNGAGEILEANLFNLPFLYQNSLTKSLDISSYRSYSFSIPKGKIKEAVEELICQLNI